MSSTSLEKVALGFAIEAISQSAGASATQIASRSALSATIVPVATQFTRLAGYSSSTGPEMLYARVATEPSHPGKVRSVDRFLPNGTVDNTNGGWWELKNVAVCPEFFGAVGDGSADDRDAVQACLDFLTARGGGRIFTFGEVYNIDSDVRSLGSNISVVGDNKASTRFYMRNSAVWHIGQATPSGSVKGGTKVLRNSFERVTFQGAGNHDGEIINVDYADFTLFKDINISVISNTGATQTNGIRCYWTQYTMFDNVESYVNGYNVHIVLSEYTPENEDHFSFNRCWLYASKERKAGTYPAGIAIERLAGRASPMGHFSCRDTHFGAFMSNGATNHPYCRGVGIINEGLGSDTRVTVAAEFESCMFEYVGVGFDNLRTAANDASKYSTTTCYFLGQDIAFLGPGYTKVSASSHGGSFIQVTTISTGVRVAYSGYHHTSGVTTISTDALSRHRYEAKGPSTTSLPGVILKNKGSLTILAGATNSGTISHGLDLTPDIFSILPRWDTAFWLQSVGTTTFRIDFATAPVADTKLEWCVEVADA